MDYEGQICRSPLERASFMLPVAVGCSYNACKFCMLFKHLKYRQLPMEQVEQEILRVKALGGDPKRVFLGDGNAFTIGFDDLMEILSMIHKHFPSCKQVNMDATVTNISQKSDDDLARLSDAGVNCLYLGIESGLDDVLAFMNKDHRLDEAYTQIARIKKYGMTYAAHIMTGIAGKGRGLENAEATALFLNNTQPCHVVNFSVFMHYGAPLCKDIDNGRYVPSDELENLCEEKRLIELLDIPGLNYEGFHDFLSFRVRGVLPKDREEMLKQTAEVIASEKQKEPLVAWTCCCPWDPAEFEKNASRPCISCR